MHFFFFFQAEDGIRDLYVTGVQTCALPIFRHGRPILTQRRRSVRLRLAALVAPRRRECGSRSTHNRPQSDRKSTRLNSSHVEISYAVFCLKKKKKKKKNTKPNHITNTTYQQ